jgi:hypothetical protein
VDEQPKVTVRGTWIQNEAIFCLLDRLTVKQNLSREANSLSGSQEIPRRLWNSEVRYHVHKSLPLVPILCWMNPVHMFTLFFS